MWAGASGVKMRILHVGLIRKTSSVLTNDNPTPISILLVYLDLKEKVRTWKLCPTRPRL
jgi:hypothetical protein